MTKNIFITGTHTGIGKTYTCVQIIRYLVQNNYTVAYYKPIQTGNSNADEKVIQQYISQDNIFCSYSLQLPATPQLAFEYENKSFDKNKILHDIQELQDKYDYVIIEGAGGVYVPISQNYLVADLIVDIQAELQNIQSLIVSSNYLGTINHTGLTLEYLKNLKINIAGFVFAPTPEELYSGEQAHQKVVNTNADIIQEHTNIKYLGKINSIEQELNNSDIIELLIK